MSRATPPRLARRLLRIVLPAEAGDEALADLDDIWTEKAAGGGRTAADRWYWTQMARSIGPALRARLRTRDTRVEEEGMMESFRRDIVHAVHQLRKHPGVGIVVVLTLSLGIGATSAIFSAVHGVLLRSLPYAAPSELVMITSRTGGSDLPRYLSGPDALELPGAVPSVPAVASFLETTVGPMTRVDRPEHILTTPVTWNVFELLGVSMALGRGFNPDDALPTPSTDSVQPPTAAVISHDFWQRSFGADPGVLGRVVYVWGGATEIVGVLPEGFQLIVPPELNIPPDGDIWRAVRSDISTWSREGRSLRTIGRLAEGASVSDAQRGVDRFVTELRATYPHHAAEGTEMRVTSLEPAVAAQMSAPLWLLMGAVVLVLLIACANVANLLLARGAARATEMAVRSSLGAGGPRLVRQLLTESAVMAGLGVVGGVALAYLGVGFLQSIRPDDLHRLADVRLDRPVLAFTVLVAAAATIASGLLPAYHTARCGLAGRMRVRGGAGVARRSRWGLVVAEVALSMVLLVGAGLLIRTFTELQRMPLGFEPDRVLTVTATQSSRPQEERQGYEADLLRAALDVPGVEAAGIVFPLPMNGVYDRSAEYAVDGTEGDPSAWTTAYFRTVNATYFEAMGLELERGRGFQPGDETYDVPIVILDEGLAQREFPGVDPIGRPLWVRGMAGDTLRAEIVGVVEYAPQWDHRDTRPTMYFPRVFYQSHEVSLVARVTGDPAPVAASLSAAIRGVDPAFPSDLVPMQEYVRERLAQSRFLLILMQIFGGLALALSAVGLFGVLSYSVRQRTRELGLRLALGAEGAALTGGVVLSGLRLAALGVGLGLVGAVIMGQALRSQLFGVGSADLVTLSTATVLVFAVAAAASLVPALRAARVDPLVALREEYVTRRRASPASRPCRPSSPSSAS